MKLKTLVASMAVLGLASTGAFAAPTNSQAGTSLQTDAFWQNIIHNNQDNAAGVQMLQTGKSAVSGVVATQLANRSKRANYAINKDNPADTHNGAGNTSLSLHTAELYFDSQVNDYTTVHVAMDYDDDFVNPGITYNGTSLSHTTNMFFPEANVTLTHGDMWATLGRQYASFGSTMHHSIITPVTEDLTKVNQTGVTLGYAMRDTGLYGDVFLYNGAPVGALSDGTNYANQPITTVPSVYQTKKLNGSANTVHGYSAEVGFAQNQGTNTWFGNDGMNVALSYLGNIQDAINVGADMNEAASVRVQTNPDTATGNASFKSAIPAYSLHADYTQGAFSVLANYVMVNKMKNTGLLLTKGSSAAKAPTPSAYNLQGVYAFTTGQHNNYVTLGYSGTQDALGFTPFGETFHVPAQRLLVNYKYDMMKNVNVELEYDMDTDYGKKYYAEYQIPGHTSTSTSALKGTGQTNDTITARLNVNF